MITVAERKQLLQEFMDETEDYIEDRVKGLVERVSSETASGVFEERFAEIQDLLRSRDSETPGYPSDPPLPENIQGSRRHAVPRSKLSGTIDPALLKLFENERKFRGCSVSRMLDIVV